VALGEGAELLADRYAISREAQDTFALASHTKATTAREAGRFDREVEPVVDDTGAVVLGHDESVRPDTTLERLARLRPSFRPEGTVTAGNSSPLNDGAAALLLAAEGEGLARTGREPLARIAGTGVAAVEPQWFGIGPVEAAGRALRRAGIGWDDLAVVELNEAFAAQALGHPLGASGARIVASLVWELRRRRARWGLAAMCIGVGQGIALVVEAA
jgi:acetyl-CoA acetyltransferase family protein